MFYPSVYYNNWTEKSSDQYVEYPNSFVNSDWKNGEQTLTLEEESQKWSQSFPTKNNKQLIDIEGEILSQNLYKTELCRTYEDTKTCRYGSKCQFAHGKEELRPVIRHPKYKTEVCKTFYTIGTCPYGKRCRFIHTRLNIDKNRELEQSKENKAPKGKFQPTSHQLSAKAEIPPRSNSTEQLWSVPSQFVVVPDQSLCTHLETIPANILEPDETELTFEEEDEVAGHDTVKRLSFFQSLA